MGFGSSHPLMQLRRVFQFPERKKFEREGSSDTSSLARQFLVLFYCDLMGAALANTRADPQVGPRCFEPKSKLRARMPRRQHFDRNPRQARLSHLQFLGRCEREIDDPPIVASQIAAIGDPHNH